MKETIVFEFLFILIILFGLGFFLYFRVKCMRTQNRITKKLKLKNPNLNKLKYYSPDIVNFNKYNSEIDINEIKKCNELKKKSYYVIIITVILGFVLFEIFSILFPELVTKRGF